MTLAEPITNCAHCGLESRSANAREIESVPTPWYCCRGCATAAMILADFGLQDLQARAAAFGARPVQSSGSTFEEFDDPEFRVRHAHENPDHSWSIRLHLEGMHCSACVWLLETLGERMRETDPGMLGIRVDLVRMHATVRWDPERLLLSRVARQLDRLGYTPHAMRVSDREASARREDRALLIRTGVAGAIAGNVMMISFALHSGSVQGIDPEHEMLFRVTSLLLSIPSVIWCAQIFYASAWRALKAGVMHMDLPISLGVAAGALAGLWNTMRGGGEVYFDSVTLLVFLLLAGRALERRQRRRAAAAADLLLALTPRFARRRGSDGGVQTVALESVSVGDCLEVRPSEVVPADGVVTLGCSEVDRSILTGESRPIAIASGDEVHAGITNLTGEFMMVVRAAGEDSRIGQIASLIESATIARPRIVRMADRIAGRFILGVVILAAITGLIWALLAPAAALDRVIAVLVVTCPCALAMATPLAISSAIGRAARRGILVKDAEVFERLAHSGVIWLDKTGTITDGELELAHFEGDARAHALVGALEARSLHPVGRALARGLGFESSADTTLAIMDLREIPGLGISGNVAGRVVAVGAPRFIAGFVGGLSERHASVAEALASSGLTPVLAAIDGEIAAFAGLASTLRPEARTAIGALRARGFSVGLLSGDHPAIVARAGVELGIAPAAARGGLSPEDKVAALEESVASMPHGVTVMIGDGVNDAAALAAAAVGIAMGGGAEAAGSAAGVTLKNKDLAALVELVDLSRQTARRIRAGLTLSLVYNLLGAGLALGGMINPLVAAILMPISSITVIALATRP